MSQESLTQYHEFLEKIDLKFQEIHSKHKNDFQCKLGCHSCCKPNLTVNALEHASIKDYFTKNPANLNKAKELEKNNPHKNKRCSMLDENGSCTIYEVRPVVCRSHGAPLQFRELKTEDLFRDVCPLNFSGKDIGALENNDVMNLDTINTLLALLTQRAYGKKSQRFALKPSSF